MNISILMWDKGITVVGDFHTQICFMFSLRGFGGWRSKVKCVCVPSGKVMSWFLLRFRSLRHSSWPSSAGKLCSSLQLTSLQRNSTMNPHHTPTDEVPVISTEALTNWRNVAEGLCVLPAGGGVWGRKWRRAERTACCCWRWALAGGEAETPTWVNRTGDYDCRDKMEQRESDVMEEKESPGPGGTEHVKLYKNNRTMRSRLVPRCQPTRLTSAACSSSWSPSNSGARVWRSEERHGPGAVSPDPKFTKNTEFLYSEVKNFNTFICS